MSIFGRGEPLGSAPRRFKIRITTPDGQVYFWHKRGQVHTVEEDVADIFIANFRRELFEVRPDGSLSPPQPGTTMPVEKLEKVPAGDDS